MGGNRASDVPEAGGATLQCIKAEDSCDIDLALTPLQRLIEEVLQPVALGRRTAREWRRLYRAFVAFFDDDGDADESERSAWKLAVDVFNTNLVAVCNRNAVVVPMTFQDFVDAADSFMHDGLQESAQRDVAWQPKKILLLLAAMVGRIIAGRQADKAAVRSTRQDLRPFQEYLIQENRKASFLGSMFEYNPHFSIRDYRSAGLKPLLQVFPQVTDALINNGVQWCEFCAAQLAGDPPLLQVHLRKPLRGPIQSRNLSSFHLALLDKPLSLADESRLCEVNSPYCDYSTTALNALAFEVSESAEMKCSKIGQMFELALANRILVCGPHQAEVSTAACIGQSLGRTRAEQFAVEQFFSLGFRNGYGNEPWRRQAEREPREPGAEKVKRARKQLGQWRDTVLFFLEAGQPEAADIPGARIRREALQPKGSTLFLSLLRSPVYAPLMRVCLMADPQAEWLMAEADLHVVARRLAGGAAKVLVDGAPVITHCVDSFETQKTRGIFLFECAAGILLTLTGAHKSPQRLADLQRARAALRGDFETLFAVALSDAPSVVAPDHPRRAALLVESKKRMLEAERIILSSLHEPLGSRVLERLEATLAGFPEESTLSPETPVPHIQLENQTKFAESIASLCAWMHSDETQALGVSEPEGRQLLIAVARVRALAETGKLEEALQQAMILYPGMNQRRKPSLDAFLSQLSGPLLGAVEHKLRKGNMDQATALSQRTIALTKGTPIGEELRSLLEELFTSRSAEKASAEEIPLFSSSIPEAEASQDPIAQRLLTMYADELRMVENKLERAFLESVVASQDTAFKHKTQLRHRLQRLTRWGGREPHKSALKLLERTITSNNVVL